MRWLATPILAKGVAKASLGVAKASLGVAEPLPPPKSKMGLAETTPKSHGATPVWPGGGFGHPRLADLGSLGHPRG
jgi:hypothetical protein